MKLVPFIDIEDFLRICKDTNKNTIKEKSEIIYFIKYYGYGWFSTIYNDGEDLHCTIWDSVGTYEVIYFKQSDIPKDNYKFNEFLVSTYKKMYEKLKKESN